MNEKEFILKMREIKKKYKKDASDKKTTNEMRKLKFIFYPKKELIKLLRKFWEDENGKDHLLFYKIEDDIYIQIEKAPVINPEDFSREAIMLKINNNIQFTRLLEESALIPFTKIADVPIYKIDTKKVKLELKSKDIIDVELLFKVISKKKKGDIFPIFYCIGRCFDKFALVKQKYLDIKYFFIDGSSDIVSVNQEKLKNLAVLWGLV